MYLCLEVSVCHDVADSLCWTWADCQTQQSISRTYHSCPPRLSFSPHDYSLCSTLLLCLSTLISILPSVSRSIFHFRLNLFDILSFLLRQTPPPPLSVFLCCTFNLLSPPSFLLSLVKSICLSMWWQPVNHHVTVSKMWICMALVCMCLCGGLFQVHLREKKYQKLNVSVHQDGRISELMHLIYIYIFT